MKFTYTYIGENTTIKTVYKLNSNNEVKVYKVNTNKLDNNIK
jgi:hypothetical protein